MSIIINDFDVVCDYNMQLSLGSCLDLNECSAGKNINFLLSSACNESFNCLHETATTTLLSLALVMHCRLLTKINDCSDDKSSQGDEK